MFIPPYFQSRMKLSHNPLIITELMGSSFHGPAPLHHTLLSSSKFAGVTVQTLNPKRFDKGKIIAQTPQPGWEHNSRTVAALSDQLGTQGADMLVDCIRSRLYLYNLTHSESPLTDEDKNLNEAVVGTQIRHAPKITKRDTFVDWNIMTAADILQRHDIIGPLWNIVGAKRVIWSGGFRSSSRSPTDRMSVGQPFVRDLDPVAYIRTCDDQILQFQEIQFEGGVRLEPFRGAAKAGMLNPSFQDDGLLFKFPISSTLPT